MPLANLRKTGNSPVTSKWRHTSKSVPDTMQRAYELAMPEWGKANMTKAQATYRVIRVAEKLWIGLAAWYPTNHFAGAPGEEFVVSTFPTDTHCGTHSWSQAVSAQAGR